MAIRTEEEVFGSQTKIVPYKSGIVSGTNPYDSIFGLNNDSVSMTSPYTPEKIANPYDSIFGLNRIDRTNEKTSSVIEDKKKSAFAGFGKAFVGAIPKTAIEYAAAGIDYLIKAGEDIGKGVTKQVPAMIQDLFYNKSDDPEIQKIINKYEGLEKEADKLPLLQRQIEKTKLNFERARETTSYQHIGEIESALGMGGQFRTQNTQRYQNIIDKLSQYQDLQNAGAVSQTVAGLIGSTPYTAGGSLPFGIGFLLNFGVQSQNNIRQKYDELKQNGGTLTAKDADNIYLYSSGGAFIDGIVEQMTGFGVSKLYGKIFGNAAKLPVKTAFRYVVKEMAKSGGGEALEEYISGMGQAVLAKITTDPNGTILTLTEEEGGLASLEGLTKNAAGAFVIGSLMETVNIKSHVNTWKSTKAALALVENKNFGDLGKDDFNLVTDAIKEDATDDDNMDSLELDLSEIIESTLESEGIIDSQTVPSELDSLYSDYVPQSMPTTMPSQAVPTGVQDVPPTQTENMPTAQANVPQAVVRDTQRALPQNNKRIPEEGNYPAVRADDGTIYWDTNGKTHIELIKGESIPPERITSGGWLVDGVYTETQQSDTMRYVEQVKAQQRVAAKREAKTANTDNITAKDAETTQKQATKPATKVYTTEPIKKKEPAVNKKDLLVKIANKQDVSKDVEEWINTAEAKAEFSDVKTVEDAVEKISDTLNDMEEDKQGLHLTGNWLQMLAYKSIADKLAKAGEVKGHDISNYVAKILTAINITAPKKVAQKLIGQFNTYDLIHLVYSNVEALKVMQARIDKSNSAFKGGFTKDALQLSRTLESGKKMPTKDDVLYLTEAVKTLVESVDTDPSALVNAEKIVKRLGRLATKGGQFIQAFSVIKNLIPEYTAMKITKAYESTVLKSIPDEQQKKFEEVVEQTTEEIKKDRKKAIKQTFDKIGSAVGDKDTTQDIDDDADTDEEKKLTPEKLLAKRIESDVNRKAPKQKDALQKALSVLFAKYKETNPSAKKQTDIYSAVADIVINRTEYARIWDEAKPIVEASKDITDEQKKSISAYFKMLANPVMAERVLNRLVNTALKDAKINMNEEAKRYLSGKESSVDTLMQYLKSKMPNIGESGLAYIKKYIEPLFDSKRSDKSQALIEAYAEAQKKLRARQAELKAKKETAKANRLAFKQTPAYAAKSIAKQIEAYAKITVADKPVNEFNQKLITRLMAKANEVLKRTPSNKENIYDTVSEIVMNREKYSDVWNSVQDVLKNNPDLANRSDLAKYFATMADPITANKYISRVIRANLKDMDTTVNKLAFDFFKSGDETISDFMDVLRTKMPEMDNASFEYLSKYVMDELKKIMSTTRNQEYERLVRQNNWMAGKKNMPKLSEEQDIIALITKAAYQNALDENLDEVRKAWATRLGIPVMTEDIKNTIYQAARDMANAPDQKTKDKIYEEMVVKVGATIPSTFPEKLTAWLRTSMLFNPTTLIRNMVNNIIAKPSYEMTDVLQNAFIKHMKDIPSEQQIAGTSYKRFNPNDEIGKSVMEMTDDDSVRRIQARFAKYSLAQLFGMEKKSFNTKWIQEIADATYGIMSIGRYKNIKIKPMGDIYMFQKYLRQSLYNKMIAQNYSASMTADQKASIVDNSMEYATMKAVTQTFRMKNILSSALLDLQKSVLKYGKAGEIANIGLKAITPFIITPVAITAESYKFSPLALAKNLAFDYGLAKITGKWKTKDAEYKVNTAHKISQAMVGTATQFGVGMILSALGFLTGDWPEDKDEKAQWESEGKKPYSIYIPGVGYIPIDWAQPVSTGVMIGAQSMQKMLDPKTTTAGKVGAFATESFNVLFKSSILQNISRQFGISYGQTPGSKVVDLVESLLFQGFPTLIRKLNAVIDPYTRDIYRGTEMQIFFNRILQSVPGGTYAIPKKIDVWGNEITTSKPTVGGAFGRFVNNFLSPFMASPDKMDAVTKEVTRVFNETSADKGSKALPSIASKTITRTTNKVKQTWELTPEQYIEYQQDIGKQSKADVEKLINSTSYKNMTDSKKAEALASIYSKAVEDAGDKIVKQYPKTK